VILVDTSVWIDHFRRGDERLASFLESGQVWCHDFVVGELACGRLERRTEILSYLNNLPRAATAKHTEVLELLESRRLPGEGLGWIDVHLLAAALIDGLPLWTRDRALHTAAKRLGVDFADG
jgi:predicted nucleic acid-binding protein